MGFVPSSSLAFLMLFVTMIAWGSWANVFKKCGNWRFEAAYFDYVWSGVLWSFLFVSIFGGITSQGWIPLQFVTSLPGIATTGVFWAIFAGLVSGFGNILLVSAITMIGFAVAFPISIGMAAVLGATLAYFTNPAVTSHPQFLFLGVIFISLAIIVDGFAYRFKEKSKPQVKNLKRGIMVAVTAGILISLSAFPFNFAFDAGLNGYQGELFLAIGNFLAAMMLLPLLIRKPIVFNQKSIGVSEYFRAKRSWHLWAIFGGLVWAIGTIFYLVAASQLSVAIAYTLGQCAPMVAALWGIFVWKEFKGAPQKSYRYLGMMFLFFISGIILLAKATG